MGGLEKEYEGHFVDDDGDDGGVHPSRAVITTHLEDRLVFIDEDSDYAPGLHEVTGQIGVCMCPHRDRPGCVLILQSMRQCCPPRDAHASLRVRAEPGNDLAIGQTRVLDDGRVMVSCMRTRPLTDIWAP